MANPWESDPVDSSGQDFTLDPNDPTSYRTDGTLKGPGFLGPIKANDGSTVTERSIGVGIDGKEVLIPSVVPTLTQQELDYVVNGGKATPEIVRKAVDFYKQRKEQGLSPFATENGPWNKDLTVEQAGPNLSDIWEGANQPLIHAVPRPFPESNPEDSTLAAIGKGAANLPSGVLNFLQSPAGIITAVGGAGLPAVAQRLMAAGFSAQQAIQAVNAKTPQERYEALFGAGLAGLGAAKGLKGVETPVETATEGAISPPSASEAAPDVQTPPVAQNSNNGRIEPITARIADKPWLSDAEAEAVNAENAPSGEAPAPDTSTAVADQVPNVRQAISLDELRLMRERSDLQMQNELAKRVSGATHPAIDQRIAAINDELDNIANSALAERFEPVPEDVHSETEAERLARQEKMIKFRPEDEPRPLDEAVTREGEGEGVAQSPGQRQNTPQQSAGLGARPQPQAGGAAGTTSQGVGVSHESLENAGLNPQRGAGRTWQESVANGRKLLNEGADPALAARRLKGETSRSPIDDADVIRAQRERLSQDVDRARAAKLANPNDPELQRQYIQAQNAEIKFVKEAVKPLGTMWHQMGMGLQGEAPVNPGDFNGLAKLARDQKGRPLEPGEEFKLQKVADNYRRVEKSSVDAADAVRQEVRRQSGGRTMSLEELVKQSEDFFKKATADCVV